MPTGVTKTARCAARIELFVNGFVYSVTVSACHCAQNLFLHTIRDWNEWHYV